MKRIALIIGIPLILFVVSVTIALVLPDVVYPEVKVAGYDRNPLQTMNKDLALDEQRRMVFLGVILAGAVLSVGTGFWLRRKPGGRTAGRP
jgi:hypothetical protein